MVQVCEICFEEADKLYECLNCDTKMCFECIGLDDECPDCHHHDMIVEA